MSPIEDKANHCVQNQLESQIFAGALPLIEQVRHGDSNCTTL